MRIARTVAELREMLHGDPDIGLVPTMGALHEGHLSLIRCARDAHRVVVVSIFVNPTQFGDAADLDAYPRDEARDLELTRAAGVDVVFAPAAREMYPDGFATTVRVSGPLTASLEGAGRGSAHFDGVATVVAKLLIATAPRAAYFGQKDAQQLLVVRRMVADLRLPVDIVACPTSREAGGLARSSRNVRLSPADRERALALPRALEATAAAVAQGAHDVDDLRARALEVLLAAELAPEYLAFVEPDTLEPVREVVAPTLCALAVAVGDVRLIDNTVLDPGPGFAAPARIEE